MKGIRALFPSVHYFICLSRFFIMAFWWVHSLCHVWYAILKGFLFIIMEIIYHKEPLGASAISGSNVSYCKEYKGETSLLLRNSLQAQLYMLTFTCMNKSKQQFYHSIPERHHLWLSKKWNATETSDHPRGCAAEAKRAHENIREEKYCSKTHIQRLFFSEERSYNAC